MNHCTHQFMHAGEGAENRMVMNQSTTGEIPITTQSEVTYIIVVCPYCGQVRNVYPDGLIHIVQDVGTVTRKKDVE